MGSAVDQSIHFRISCSSSTAKPLDAPPMTPVNEAPIFAELTRASSNGPCIRSKHTTLPYAAAAPTTAPKLVEVAPFPINSIMNQGLLGDNHSTPASSLHHCSSNTNFQHKESKIRLHQKFGQSGSSLHSLKHGTVPSPLPLMAASSKSSILYQGALFKRGQHHRTWKERWFVLRSDFKLRYYESQSKSDDTVVDKNLRGTIDTSSIERIEVSSILDLDESQIPESIQISDKKTATSPHHNDQTNGNGNDAKEDTIPSSQTTLKNYKSDSGRSLLIYLVTSSRTYKLSASDSESFIEWLENLDKYLYGEVIMESFLDKKGSDHKSYKQRYFVMNRYRQIKYYNNEQRETLHGVIDLNDESLTLQYSMNEQLIEIRSEKRKWILFAKDADLYRKWVSTLRSNKTIIKLKGGYTSPSSHDVLDPELWTAPETVNVVMKQGDVFKEWMKAQKEMKGGDQPTVCMMYGIRLKRLGQIRRKGTTVADLQDFLIGAGVGQRPLRYVAESADYTDNEMTDDEDEEDDDDDLDGNNLDENDVSAMEMNGVHQHEKLY